MIPIGVTGVRNGETLLGIGMATQNKGSLIRVYKKGAKLGELIVPTDKKRLDRYEGDYSELQKLEAFRNMSPTQIKEYLYSKAGWDIYMSDDPDLLVEPLALSGQPFERIPVETMDSIMRSGKLSVPLVDVYNAIPGNRTDTKASRHTLVFRSSIWAVVDRSVVFEGDPDITYDMETLSLVDSISDGSHRVQDFLLDKLRMTNDKVMKLRVVLPADEGDDLSSPDEMYSELTGLSLEQIRSERALLDPFLSKLTPGVLKSSMQKIIRTGAAHVLLPWTQLLIDRVVISSKDILESNSPSSVSGDLYLLLSFEYLYRNPGSFVPDLRLFVTGIESAFKRLGVSISEDAYTEDYEALLGLYIAAMIVRSKKSWRPSIQLLYRWLKLALDAKNNERVFSYDKITVRDAKDIEELTCPLEEYSSHHVLYRVLSQLGSLYGDIQMVGTTDGTARASKWTVELMEAMPVEQIIDHHSIPEMSYMLHSERVLREESFHRLHNDIFYYVTGLNPRRTDRNHKKEYYKEFEQTDFAKSIRVAQRFVIFAKTHIVPPPIRKCHKRDVYTIDSDVDDSWLVGMLGVSELYHKKVAYYVGLNASDIYSYMIMKRPNRNLKDGTVTSEARAAITKQFREMLTAGIRLKHVPKALSVYEGAKLQLREYSPRSASSKERKAEDLEHVSEGGFTRDLYYLNFGKNRGTDVLVEWEEAQTLHKEFKILEALDTTFMNSISHADGVSAGAHQHLDEMLDRILSEPDQDLLAQIMHRIGLYVDTNRTSIEMYKVSRSGEGQELPVKGIDTIVYKLLSDLTILYPAAIRRSPTSPTKRFDLVYAPLFWEVKKHILERMKTHIKADDRWKLALTPVQKGFSLYDYQQTSVDRMIVSDLQGKRGSLINGPTGVGKTAIVLGFLREYVKKGKMPRYCLYTLPRSAKDRISDELTTMGIPYRFLRTTNPGLKTLRKKDGKYVFMEPYEVTIILHDDLRRNEFPAFAKSVMKDTLLIIDEFHMAMADSLRTGIVMELMNLCGHFVGMSATVIRGDDLSPVIAWVEQLVDFEVTKHNFWAAMSAMITLFVKLDIVTEHIEETAPFSDSEAEQYRDLLQRRGGPHDFNAAVNLCYYACLRAMIERTELLLGVGRYKKQKAKERGVFFIAKNSAMARKVVEHFRTIMKKDEIHMIGKDSTVSIRATDKTPIRLLITTPSYSMGYDATKMTAVVQTVYFVNQSIREQLDGRLVRIGQDRKVTFYTFYVGVLENIWQRYKLSGSMSKALKGAGQMIGISDIQLKKIE